MADPTVPVYCSLDDIRAAVGSPTGQDDRLSTAAILGSRYVDSVVGNEGLDTDLTPPYSIVVVACPPAYRQAAIAAGVRFLKSPDIPFGAVGGLGDAAVYVRGATIPEVDLILTGHRASFGVA